MKKVTTMVIYNSETKQIFNLTVTTRAGENITLINSEKPSKMYADLHGLTKDVLKILKNNNFYMEGVKQFGAIFYPISYIDAKHPYDIKKYGFIEF